MAPTKGAYRKHAVGALYLRGMYIAVLLDPEKTKTFGGVERPVMKARCWVGLSREGNWAYSPKVYGTRKQTC